MSQVINKIKQSKLAQRVLAVGGAYLALEVLAAVGVLVFFANDIVS
jgi:hypothetical protein